MPTRIGWLAALGAALVLSAGCSSLPGNTRGTDKKLRDGAEIASAVGERTRAEYEGDKDGELVRYASSLEDAHQDPEGPAPEDGSDGAPSTKSADASKADAAADAPESAAAPEDPTDEDASRGDGADEEGADEAPGGAPAEEDPGGEPAAEDEDASPEDAPPKKDAPAKASEAPTP